MRFCRSSAMKPYLHNVDGLEYEPKPSLPEIVADQRTVEASLFEHLQEWDRSDGGRRDIDDPGKSGPGRKAGCVWTSMIPVRVFLRFLIDKIFDPFFTTKEKGIGLGFVRMSAHHPRYGRCQILVSNPKGLVRHSRSASRSSIV